MCPLANAPSHFSWNKVNTSDTIETEVSDITADRGTTGSMEEGKYNCYSQEGEHAIKYVAGNYRPVSLTSIICKVMESIVRDALVKYMKDNLSFTDRQFDFPGGRSTTLQ